MSMILYLRQITPEQMAEALKNEDYIQELLGVEFEDENEDDDFLPDWYRRLPQKEKDKYEVYFDESMKGTGWKPVILLKESPEEKNENDCEVFFDERLKGTIWQPVLVKKDFPDDGEKLTDSRVSEMPEPVKQNSPDDEKDEFDIDQSWHGIHFLLTKTKWHGKPPLFNVIFGPEIGKNICYGPAMYNTPEDVKEVAQALESITPQEMAKRFDRRLKSIKKADLHCISGTEEDRDYIVHHYERLREFFMDAAARGNAILKSIE